LPHNALKSITLAQHSPATTLYPVREAKASALSTSAATWRMPCFEHYRWEEGALAAVSAAAQPKRPAEVKKGVLAGKEMSVLDFDFHT
jgi:hypothetical protein